MYTILSFPTAHKNQILLSCKTYKHTTSIIVTIKRKAKYIKVRILNFSDFDQLEMLLKQIEKQFKIRLSQKHIDMMLAKILYLQNQYPNYHQLNLILPQSVFEIPFTPM